MTSAQDQIINSLATELVKIAGGLRARLNKWSAEELELLRLLFPHVRTGDLAAALGRSYSSVHYRAKLLGLEKSQAFRASPKSGRTGHDDRGAAGRFNRGNVPHNKGKRWHAGGRSVETQFKPGQAPKNWMPIGSERIRSDGTRERKMTDTGNTPRDWVPIAQITWAKHHGPIPRGHLVRMKDSNPANCLDISNLECISKAENMRRNTRHRYPQDINDAISAKAALSRRINKLEKRT